MRRKAVALTGATCLVTSLVVSSLASAGPAWAGDEGSGSVQMVQPVEPSADPGGQAKPAAAESKAIKDERIALELKFARGEGKSKDTRGHMRSLYQGKWYMPKKEAVRKCIIDRESNFDYKAVSRGGIYRGAYQMNRALAVGVSWMMQKEIRKEMGPEGLKLVRALRSTKTQLWNRYMQDRAFWTIWRKGKGSRHWGVGATMCIKKAKRAEARRKAEEAAQAKQDGDANQDGDGKQDGDAKQDGDGKQDAKQDN
jgi:hypothetical protein